MYISPDILYPKAVHRPRNRGNSKVGLPLWLATEGRLVGSEEARARASDPSARDVAREMAVVQAVLVDARLATRECLSDLGGQAGPGEATGAPRPVVFTDESSQKLVTASYSEDGDAFVVRGDRARLKKAVAHLIGYLLRKTPGPEAKLAVSVSRRAGDPMVRITVASRSADVAAGGLRGGPAPQVGAEWTGTRADDDRDLREGHRRPESGGAEGAGEPVPRRCPGGGDRQSAEPLRHDPSPHAEPHGRRL